MTDANRGTAAVRRWAFVGFAALLPLHTVFFQAWVSWKPFLVLLVLIVLIDLGQGWRARRWPYDLALTLASLVFGASVGVGVVITDSTGRFARLLFALAVGVAVLLVTERSLRIGDRDRLERAVVWSAAAMALTAFVLSIVVVGGFGSGAFDAINDLPGVFRVGKAAYLETGFVSLTNWHQDPGYAAAWMNLWAVAFVVLAAAGRATGRTWLDGMVVGGLGLGTLMTMSRSGWLGWAVGLSVAAVVLVRWGGAAIGRIVRLGGIAVLTAVLAFGVVWAADRGGVGGDLDDQFGFRLEQNASLGTVGQGPLEPGTGEAADIRANVWPFYWDAFTGHPVLGIGLGSGWAAPGIQEPHNLGLQLLGESGVLGALGFAVLAVAVLRRRGGAAAGAILVVAMMPAFFQTLLFEPTWWFAAGLFAARFPGTLPDVPAMVRR